MKTIKVLILILAIALAAGSANAQKLNGENIKFPNGNREWSDTIFKKMLTAEMKEKGQKSVLLAIRVKILDETQSGRLYNLEITNKSDQQKVSFDIVNQNNITPVRLKPGQTRVFEMLKWTVRTSDITPADEYYWEYPGLEFIKE